MARGEIVGIIGPNGAGKSSLLRAIAGLVQPSGGSIDLKGRSLLAVEPFERVRAGVALAPEGRGLFPNMSVEENLLMGAYTVQDPARVRENMERVFSLFPDPPRPAPAIGGDPLGRAAADARHRRGAHGQPRAVHVR